jgi:hypothetical protein
MHMYGGGGHEAERGGVLPALGGIISGGRGGIISGGSVLRIAASVTASASKRVPGLLLAPRFGFGFGLGLGLG